MPRARRWFLRAVSTDLERAIRRHARVFALAGLVAGPALALSGFEDVAGMVCQAVQEDAPEEIEAACADCDTSVLDAGARERPYRAIRSASADRARNIADCRADMNERQAQVEEGAREDDRDCAKDVKESRELDDTLAKGAARGTREVCRQLESDCQSSFEAGTLFPS